MPLEDVEISDEELTALSLAADPNAPIDEGVEPFGAGLSSGTDLLPEWYMPVPNSNGHSHFRSIAVAAIVASLIVVNGAGLCVTYGLPEIAW
jgi:hypothetical protein